MGTPNKLAPADIQAKAIALLAGGHSVAHVSETVGVAPRSLTAWLRRNNGANLELVRALRSIMKLKIAEALQKRIATKAIERLDKALDSGDAKEVDALSRSLLNIEKVSTSIAGEGKEAKGRQAAPQVKIVLPDWAQGPKPVVIEHEPPSPEDPLDEEDALAPDLR